jgi:uncharacterized protein (DUF305 family)
MRNLSRTSIVAAVLGATALLLAACGGDDTDTTTASSAAPAAAAGSTTAAPSAAAEFNDADVMFAQSMIPHHEQAVQMADLALAPGAGASREVVALAERIQGAQEPEIEQMTGWLQQWGAPVEMDMSDGHDMGSMEGMMSDADLERLGGLSGAEFDETWMEAMIAHHEGAIAMAEDVKADGASPDVRVLADAIITGQQAEIDEMRSLLGS